MIPRLSTEPEENEVETDCGICGGTGEIVVPAHEEAGRIVDETYQPCVCQIRDTDE